MNVLSLFDGISCGRLALERAGILVNNYYSSEICKDAMKVSNQNFPDIIQLGDVRNIQGKNLPKIDLLIGGSPCTGFSIAGKQLAFEDDQSKLFFEYERLLKETSPKYFLLENVKMKKEYRDIISNILGVEPIFINSSLLSAQNRPRYYWTNIPNVLMPEDKNIYLIDILEKEIDHKYYIKNGRADWLKKFGEIKEKQGYIAFNPIKAKCLTVRSEPSWNTTYIIQYPRGTNKGGIRSLNGKVPSITTSCWEHNNILIDSGAVRKLTPIECERLQTIPDNYTNCISDSKRYKVLGNAWTVDIISHILSFIKE